MQANGIIAEPSDRTTKPQTDLSTRKVGRSAEVKAASLIALVTLNAKDSSKCVCRIMIIDVKCIFRTF